jgi:hypothetical protein
VTAFVLLAAAQELSGDHKAAQATLEAARKLNANLSIDRVDQQLKPGKPQAQSAWHSILDSLERAGLKR